MKSGVLNLVFFFVLFRSFAQDSITVLKAPENFKDRHKAISYFNKIDQTIHVDLEYGWNVSRYLYDTSFQLLKEYTIPKTGYFYAGHKDTLNFASEMITKKGVFEIFRDRDDIVVYHIDFEKKKDEKVFELRLRQSEYDEKMLAVLPDKNKLRIISYSSKKDKLNLYTWFPGEDVTKKVFDLPEHNLSPQEEKKFGNLNKIKFKKYLSYFPVNRTDMEYPVNIPGNGRVFYNDEKIYIGLMMPNYLGVYLMEIGETEIKHYNFIINAGMSAIQADYYKAKRPFFTVYDSLLIINNSSIYQFEFLFYSLNTLQQLKKYSVPVKDSISRLVHSELIQKGTYGSRNQEKVLEKEKRFMLRMIDGSQFITLSGISADSLTITFGSYNQTAGLGGTLLAIGTGMLSSFAFLNVNNAHFIVFIISIRNKFLYSHSRFSNSTFTPSNNTHVITITDKLLDDLDVKEIVSSSTFLVQINSDYYIGAYNKEIDKFKVFRYSK
jgi:hypothetical protein